MFTINEAKRWARERADELHRARLACEDENVRFMNRIMPGKSIDLWNTGCWLSEVLDEMDATEEQISSIQMAAGQRSLCADPWEVAVAYANEFAAHGDTSEKGGAELADKIVSEQNQ